jgi:hypothetical protein
MRKWVVTASYRFFVCLGLSLFLPGFSLFLSSIGRTRAFSLLKPGDRKKRQVNRYINNEKKTPTPPPPFSLSFNIYF